MYSSLNTSPPTQLQMDYLVWEVKDSRMWGQLRRLPGVGCNCRQPERSGAGFWPCEGQKAEALWFILIKFLCPVGSPASFDLLRSPPKELVSQTRALGWWRHHPKVETVSWTRLASEVQLLLPLMQQSGIKDQMVCNTPFKSVAEWCIAVMGDRTWGCFPCPAELELLLLVREAARKPSYASDSYK